MSHDPHHSHDSGHAQGHPSAGALGHAPNERPAATRRGATKAGGIQRESTAQRRLRESEERYHALFERAAVGLLHVALDGRVLRANAVLCQMLGYSAAEIEGHHFSEFTHPDDVAANQALYERAASGEATTQTMEKRYRTKDGTLLWAALSATLVRDGQGRPQYLLSTVENINARKALETTLLRSAQQMSARAGELEAVFDAVSDALIVYDRSGQIVRMNEATRRLLGLPPDMDYAALTLHERATLIELRDVEGHLLSPTHWPHARILRGETIGGALASDIQVRTLDGRELTLNISGAPTHDEHGQLTGAVIILRDVSERRRLERRAHETLAALLAMAEALVASGDTEVEARSAQTAALRLVDLTRKVVNCQRASIHAIDVPDERMRPVAVVGMHAEMERAWWDEWTQRPRLADVLDADTRARLRGGEVSIIDLTQPIFNSYPNPYQIVTVLVVPMRLGDRLVGMLALDHDRARHEYSGEEIALAVAVAKLAALVIEREHLLEQREAARASALALREANHHMDDFLSMASHELRNPLTSIRASIQLAKRRIKKLSESSASPLTAEAVARLLDPLERGERQTSLLDRLVGDLLDVSRIRTNRLDLRMAEVDLASLARDVVEQHRFAHPGHVISLTLPERMPVLVRADPDRISQVITNYLTNALKYSPEDCPIAVSLEVTDRQARLRVRDQGPGLPSAEQSLIWERFHRAPGITASGGKSGLGLGLFISRGFIERHGGQVGVESEFGHGSTFWFTLPLTSAS